MKNRFFLTLSFFLFIHVASLFPLEKIFLIYKDFEYNLIPVSAKEIETSGINILKEIDDYQRHRIILETSEKMKLSGLSYVGDKLELNGIEISLIYADTYQIKYPADKITLKFSIGEKSELLLKTALNYKISSKLKDYKTVKTEKSEMDKSLNFDAMDIIASSVYVKELLRRMIMLPDMSREEKKSPSEISPELVNEQYEKFIENLVKMDKTEILKSITKFIEYNIRTSGAGKVTEKWTTPAALYFFKEGDYKSIALFYYNTLKRIDEINTKKNKPKSSLFNPKPYFAIALEKKNKADADTILNVFTNKYKSIDDMNRIQALEMQYKRVVLNEELNYNPDRPSFSKPQNIYFYKAPELSASTFLVAINIEDGWIYTTGEKWVNPKLSLPERCPAHFFGNGCYYTLVEKDYALISNQPIDEKDILWNVFYSTK
jgi:hypothetical protein